MNVTTDSQPSPPFPAVSPASRIPLREWLQLAAIILPLLALNFYFAFINHLPESYDPANHFLASLDHARYLKGELENAPASFLDLSGYYPPVFYWVESIFLLIFGESVLVARLGVNAFLVLALVGFYLTGRRLGGHAAGLLCAALAAITPGVAGFSRTLYLEIPLLAMTLLCFDRLCASRGGHDRRAMLLAGVFAGLAVLTKWTAPLFLIAPAITIVAGGAFGYDVARGERVPAARARLGENVLLSIIAALAIAGPWYLRHGTFVLQQLRYNVEVNAPAEGDPTLWTLANWLYYSVHCQAVLSHMGIATLLLVSFVWACRSPVRRQLAPLLLYGACAYVTLSLIENKDARYGMPLLIFAIPPAALLARALLQRRWGITIVTALFCYGSIATIDLTFDFPFLPRHAAYQTRFGEVVWWSKARAGTRLGVDEHWPNQEIVDSLSASQKSAGIEDATAVVCINHHALNPWTLGIESRLARQRLKLMPPLPSDSLGVRMRQALHADFLLLKPAGYNGPPFTLEPAQFIFDDLYGSGRSVLRSQFSQAKVYGLPDGTTAAIYLRNEKSSANWMEAGFRFGDRATLQRVRIAEPVAGVGKTFVVEAEWTVDKPILPEDKITFFVHLDTQDGETVFSDMQWLEERLPTPERTGNPQIAVHDFHNILDKQHPADVLEVRVGLWNAEENRFLELITPHGVDNAPLLPAHVWWTGN